MDRAERVGPSRVPTRTSRSSPRTARVPAVLGGGHAAAGQQPQPQMGRRARRRRAGTVRHPARPAVRQTLRRTTGPGGVRRRTRLPAVDSAAGRAAGEPRPGRPPRSDRGTAHRGSRHRDDRADVHPRADRTRRDRRQPAAAGGRTAAARRRPRRHPRRTRSLYRPPLGRRAATQRGRTRPAHREPVQLPAAPATRRPASPSKLPAQIPIRPSSSFRMFRKTHTARGRSGTVCAALLG
ncbi:MAG: hypothetical protein JWQ81_1069 [Amycolatopsis sp.]|nr:hypothetical protein [Amycolatopsis sp.]